MENKVKKTKNIIIGCAGLVLILIAGLVIAQDEGIETQTINRAVIKIDTLSCGGCFSTISSGLVPMEGYSGMGANLFRKLIAVDFTDPLTADQISEKLSEVGYPGTVESVEQVSQKESFAYLESKRTGFGSSGGGCCSSGSAATVNSNAGDSSSLAPQSGGSCCAVPNVSQPVEDL